MTQKKKGSDSARKKLFALIGWQSCQWLCCCLFLWVFYQAERTLTPILVGDSLPSTLPSIEFFLLGEQLSFLPGKMWKLFWPMSLIAFAFLALGRLRWYFLAVMGFISGLVLIGDRIYYEFFYSLLSWRSLIAANQAWAVRSSITAAMNPMDILFLSSFLLLLPFGFFLNKYMTPTFKKHPRMFAVDKVMGGIIFFLTLHNGVNAFQVPTLEMNKLELAQNLSNRPRLVPRFLTSSGDFALHFGLFNYHLKDIYDRVSGKMDKRPLTEAEARAVYQVLDKSYQANKTDSPLKGIARGRNVIVVSMEAFQQYVLGLTVGDTEVTPNLNRLRETSLVWDHILDNVAKGGTSDAEFSLLTGLMPDPKQIISLDLPANPGLLGLPATLAELNYQTLSLHGFRASFWNRNTNHPLLGIREMLFQEAFKFKRLGLGVADEIFFEQSAELLANRDQPFFAFMISLSSHHPYTFLPFENDGIANALPASQARDYYQSVHYADGAFGNFLSHLHKQNLLNNSMLVVYGDHVAAMDLASKELIKSSLGVDVRELREQRIPLMIILPGLEAEIAAHRDTYRGVVGGLQDVFPTVLHLIGADVPFGIYGSHLLMSKEEKPTQPVFKKRNGFVRNGVMYSSDDPQPIRDARGILFDPQGKPASQAQHKQWFVEASYIMYAHQLMLNQDAQDRALKMHRKAVQELQNSQDGSESSGKQSSPDSSQ